MNNNRGFISLPLILIVGTAFIIAGVSSLFVETEINGDSPNLGAQIITVRQGGTGRGSFPLQGYVYGNGTDKLLATSSPTFGWITATTTGTASILQDLTVLGTCTGCGGGGTTEDMQDAYETTLVLQAQ